MPEKCSLKDLSTDIMKVVLWSPHEALNRKIIIRIYEYINA